MTEAIKQKSQEAKEFIENTLKTKLNPQDDIRAALEDGAVLCKLIQALKPGVIKDFQEDPKFKYNKIENLNKFKNAALTLGVSKDQLFEFSDVIDAHHEGPVKLVNCILALAKAIDSKTLTKSSSAAKLPPIVQKEQKKQAPPQNKNNTSGSGSESSSESPEEKKAPSSQPSNSGVKPSSPKPTVPPANEKEKSSSESESGTESTSTESSEEAPQQKASTNISNVPSNASAKNLAIPQNTGASKTNLPPKATPAQEESSSSEEESSSEDSGSSSSEEPSDQNKKPEPPKQTSPVQQNKSPTSNVIKTNKPVASNTPDKKLSSSEEITPQKPSRAPVTKPESEESSSEEENKNSKKSLSESKRTSRHLNYDSDEEKRKDLLYEIHRLRRKIEDQREDRKVLELKCDNLKRDLREIRKKIENGEFKNHKANRNETDGLILKEGWLERSNPDDDDTERWIKVYTVLKKDGYLKFFKNARLTSKRGEVKLAEATCFAHVEKEEKNKPLYFNIRNSAGDFLLRAQDRETKVEWVTLIKPLCKGNPANFTDISTKLNRGSSFLGEVSISSLNLKQESK